MGARQVLRAALVAALLLATRSALAAPVAAGVLDLRAADADRAPRDAVAAAVAARPGVTLVGNDRAAALAGEADLAAAEALRDDAVRAYGEQGCAVAAAPLREAIFAYLRVADPADVAGRLERPLGILLECAQTAGDTVQAEEMAARLRALGLAAPAGTGAITAGQLTITTDPAGARVFVDLALAGPSPVKVDVPAGERWIIAHHAGRLRSVTAVGAASTHLVLGAAPAEQILRERVAAWRAAGHQASAADITTIMREARLELVVVLTPAGEAQIWTLGARAAVAKPAGKASLADPEAVGEAASGAVALLGPAGELPEGGLPPEPKPAKKVRSPWIYAAVAGAVVLGAGLLYLTQSGGDTQHIEINFP